MICGVVNVKKMILIQVFLQVAAVTVATAVIFEDCGKFIYPGCYKSVPTRKAERRLTPTLFNNCSLGV